MAIIHTAPGKISCDELTDQSIPFDALVPSRNSAASRWRSLLKELVPPILVRAARGLARRTSTSLAGGWKWRRIATGPLSDYWLDLDTTAAVWTGRMVRGEFEIPTAAVLDARIQRGWNCFDVGAHVGYHTMLMAKLVGSTGSVHAFEPLPHNLDRIKRHIERNDQQNIVRVHALALSDSGGTGTMRGTDDLATSSGGYLLSARPPLSASYVNGYRNMVVEQRTLDQIVDQPNMPAPDLIKIDVEGAEVSVLRGAAETLRKWKPFLIIEFHNAVNAVEGMEILHQAGYRTAVIDFGTETCSITAETL